MNITIEVAASQVVWTDQDFNPLNTIDGILTGIGMDPIDDIILSLDLMINEVQVSNAGVYTCYTIINDTLGDSVVNDAQHTLTVESKSLNIVVITIIIISCILDIHPILYKTYFNHSHHCRSNGCS